MRLTYLANLRMPTEKAYGIQISKMCEAFADVGLDVKLLIPRRKNYIDKSVFDYYGVKNTFTIKKIFSPDFYLPGRFDKISVAIKNFISAVALSLHSLFNTDSVYSRDELPLYFLSFFKKNIYFEAHKFSSRRRLFYGRFQKAGTRLVVISRGLKNEFVKFGFDPGSVLVGPDGVDLEEFQVSCSQEQCRLKLGLPADKKIIGYVGQLRTMGMEKGVDNLINALRSIKRAHDNCIVAVVGGSKNDLAVYRELARKTGLDHDDILFLGHKEHKLIPMYLKSFDVLVMPFPNNEHYSSFMSPLKLFEYMASGRPIVASDLPSVKEILSSEEAVFVKPDDSESLAGAIISVIENPELSNKISQGALKLVERYTWIKRAETIMGFLR